MNIRKRAADASSILRRSVRSKVNTMKTALLSKPFSPLVFGVGLILLLDQYTKYLVRRDMLIYESIPVIRGFFNLTHVTNSGVAFSIGANAQSDWVRYFFITVSVLAIIALIAIYRDLTAEDKRLKVAFIMILGGALGNLVDRLMFGKVTDFLDLYWGRHHWPVFNVADSCITIGVGIVLASWILSSRSKSA